MQQIRPVKLNTARPAALATAVMLVALVVPLIGCESTPTYTPPPPVQTQPIDARSADLLINDAAQYIVTELPQAPGVRDTQHRLVLGLGPIEVSNFNEPRRFVTVMRQLNTRLMANKSMTRIFRMVQISVPTSTAVTQALGGGHSHDAALPDSDAPTGPKTYDPRDIYILTGAFTQFGDRGNELRALRLTISVEHPHSREVLISKQFNRNFAWDSASGTWKPTD